MTPLSALRYTLPALREELLNQENNRRLHQFSSVTLSELNTKIQYQLFKGIYNKKVVHTTVQGTIILGSKEILTSSIYKNRSYKRYFYEY